MWVPTCTVITCEKDGGITGVLCKESIITSFYKECFFYLSFYHRECSLTVVVKICLD